MRDEIFESVVYPMINSNLIDREKLKKDMFFHQTFLHNGYRYVRFNDVSDALDNASPIEAIPVTHGYWKERLNLSEKIVYDCSECDTTSREKSNFCSYCGSVMDRPIQRLESKTCSLEKDT